MVQRKDIKTEDIVRLYQEENLIGREIAELLECSVPLVQQRLFKAGVSMRPCNDRRVIEIDKTVLKEIYWDKKMHPVEIGKELGIHKNTVTKKMREYDISLRTKSEARIKELNPIYGVGHSKKAREKMSQLFLKGRRKVSLTNQYGNPTRYKEITYRSTWEAGAAFYLDCEKIPYVYEYKSFPYKDKCDIRRSYTPDFYLPKGLRDKSQPCYIEIKGIFRDRDLSKIEQANKIENVVIHLWDYKKLQDLGVINSAGKIIVGLDAIHKIIIE